MVSSYGFESSIQRHTLKPTRKPALPDQFTFVIPDETDRDGQTVSCQKAQSEQR